MNAIFRDLRYGWRALRQHRALTIASILCLGLGIGANTAVFSVANQLLLRRLAVGDPDGLVAIHRTVRTVCCSESSWPIYRDIGQLDVFSAVEAHYPLLALTLAGAGEPQRVWGQLVSSNYFSVLGVKAALGRTFLEEDHTVAIVSHSFWRRALGGDPAAIGRRLALNHFSFTVIGVAPPGFRGIELALVPEIWVPMAAMAEVMPQRPSLADRTAPWLLVNARLRPGISRQRAQAALTVLARRLEQNYRATDRDRGFLLEPASAFHPAYRGAVVGFVGIAAAVVALVLLVASVNVANMLLARAIARRKEIALRVALGAGRGALIRQMLVESLLLALSGGAAGLLLSLCATRLLTAVRLPIPVPVEFNAPLDLRVLGFTFALATLAGLAFGLSPALHAARTDLVPALKDAPARGRPARFRGRDLLVCGQVAASLLLLIVTGLFLRSLATAWAIDPGFETRRLLLLSIDPRLEPNPATLMAQIRERVAAMPGVAAATYTDVAPLAFGGRAVNVVPEARETPPLRADAFLVGESYFRTLGIPLLRGRDFKGAGARNDPVVIVNQALAELLWPAADPIGRRLRRDGRVYEVIGLARNTKTRTLGEAPRPCVYHPFEQDGARDATPFGLVLMVQSAGRPAALAASVRLAIHGLAPGLALSEVRTMEQQLQGALLLPRLGALLSVIFGAVGLLLTAVGLYGVISYSVARSHREFGIRAAIGARPGDVLRLVMRRGAALAATGAAAGLAAAFAATRLVSSVLYGVSPTDPFTFAAVPAFVIAVALLASYIPARRAARLDPLQALRAE